jgi:hypothetical protein
VTTRAAFAEVDITPTVPCEKPGWIVKIIAQRVLDPLFARVCVFESNAVRVALISLDVISVRWPIAEAIRDHAQRLGIPRSNVLVAATHNHTGPPVSSPGLATKDPRYIEHMIQQVVAALSRAVADLQPVKIAIASGIESRISFIRRAIMKDGSVRTHPRPGPDIRCCESVIDPEVAVIAVNDNRDRRLGFIANFACHPVHDGGEPIISAGWPGVFASSIKQATSQNCVPMFLNGAFGDVHHQNPLNCDQIDTNTKQRVGTTLASTVLKMLDQMQFDATLDLAASRKTIQIPLRDPDGPFGENFKLRQRFAPDGVYETLIAKLRQKKTQRDHVLAEVQAIRLTHDTALIGLPCEPFSALGLEIKSSSPFTRTWIIGAANGMIGYVPTDEAFKRGGYETTLSMGSKLDPSAGRTLVQTALTAARELRAV